MPGIFLFLFFWKVYFLVLNQCSTISVYHIQLEFNPRSYDSLLKIRHLFKHFQFGFSVKHQCRFTISTWPFFSNFGLWCDSPIAHCLPLVTLLLFIHSKRQKKTNKKTLAHNITLPAAALLPKRNLENRYLEYERNFKEKRSVLNPNA